MKKVLVIILLAFVTLLPLLNGCVPSKEAADDERVLSPDRLVKKLEANRRKIKTFEGNGVININSPEVTAKANFEVVLKKPDSIRVSIYGPFGIDLAHALVTPRDFVFYDVIRGNVYTGLNREGIIKDIFKVDIEFEDLMDAFAGAVNLTDKLRREPDMFDTEDDAYMLTYLDEDSGKESVYEIEIDNLAITDYSLTVQNTLMFTGDYSDFRDFEGVAVPYSTIIENTEKNQRAIIEYRNIKVNHEVEGLDVNIPSGVNYIDVE